MAWIPSGPRGGHRRSAAAAVVLAVCLSASLTAPAEAAFDPSRMRAEALEPGWPGYPRLAAADLDGDGDVELLGFEEEYLGLFYALDWAAGEGELRVLYGAEPQHRPINFALGDVDLDGALEVVAINNDLTIHAAADGRLVDGWTATDATWGVAVADVEPQPGAELVIYRFEEIAVHEAASASPLWTMPVARGAWRMAVGQLDADPAVELAVAAPDEVVVYDLAARSQQGTWPTTGRGTWLAVADLDGGAVDELLVRDDDGVSAVDVDAGRLLWLHAGAPGPAASGDVDADGTSEAVLEGPTGELDILDGPSGAPERSLPLLWSPDDLILGDFDGDCEPEVALAGRRHGLLVADLGTGASEWQRPYAWRAEVNRSLAQGFDAGDVDRDGDTELVHVAEVDDGSARGGLVRYIDRQRGVEVRRPDLVAGPPDEYALTLAQLDADPQLEYVLASGAPGAWDVVAFDGVDHAEQWRVPLTVDQVIVLTSADLEADGTDEIFAATYSNLSPRQVFVLEGDGRGERWSSPGFAQAASHIRVGDFDRDNTREIVFGTEFVLVYDGLTFQEEWRIDPGGQAFDVGDVDDDGDDDLVFADAFTGEVSAFDFINRTAVFTAERLATELIGQMRIADVDGDDVEELVVLNLAGIPALVYDRQLQIYRGTDRALLWTSQLMRGGYNFAALAFADVDDDGRGEFVLNSESSVHSFGYDSGADATPPQFDGAPGLQSATATDGCCPRVDLDWGTATDDANPPVRFEVHRDTAAGFTPSPATVVELTRATSYRDRTVVPDTTYYYVVQAVDAAGNRDANRAELSARATGGDRIPPDQGNVVRAVRDADEVHLTFPGAPATKWRVYMDADKRAIGTTPLSGVLTAAEMIDAGAVPAPDDRYYDLRGLSECSSTPGP